MTAPSTALLVPALVLALGVVTVSAQSPPPPPDGSAQGRGDPAQDGGQEPPRPPAGTAGPDHSMHVAPGEQTEQPPSLPPITDEDRAAAFPKLRGQHAVHDDSGDYLVLFDQLEWQAGGSANRVNWDNKGWVGGDVHRFWFRSEGEAAEGRLEQVEAHLLYGRPIARWWDLVVGLRQDFRPGDPQAWAAVGIQGLAPCWFAVEATAYVGAAGRTHMRLETEYELLLTNRLVLQPLLEVDIFGKSDPERETGAGLSSADLGFRLRYELRRELAPYVGMTWNRLFFGTADLARAAGGQTGGARLAVGLRAWF